MVGATQEDPRGDSKKLIEIAEEAMQSTGKYLNSDERIILKDFLSTGIERMESMSYNEIQIITNRLKYKIESVTTPTSSMRDILRNLCPLDPFC